jgi:uncharacterized membrane protein
MQESLSRTVIKSFLWQLLGLFSMSLVGYLTTGSWLQGGKIALISVAIGIFTYFIYERIWTRIQWGLNPVPTSHKKPDMELPSLELLSIRQNDLKQDK